jgi:protein required for attachment to host cells
MRIENATWIAVADGARFLLLHNDGDADYPRLRMVEHMDHQNPPSRDQGTDRPGRMPDQRGAAPQTRGEPGQGPHPGPRSALETTDWHRIAEEDFARQIAARLSELAGQGQLGRLLLVADPRSLGRIRAALAPSLSRAIVAEVARDLTGQPLPRIAEVLQGL